VDPDGVGFEPVQVPTLARRPTGGNHAYPPHLAPAVEAGSPWIPQTPESPYPATLLSPRQFSRNQSMSDASRANSFSRQQQQQQQQQQPLDEDDSPWRAL
jgi:hypothetical protein